MFPYAQVFQDAIIGSDHSPLLLDFCVSPSPARKAFKFESLWTSSPNCLPTIRDNWLVHAQGSAMFRWSFRLKALKKNLAPTAENLKVQQAIHKTMEIIMAREEMYLHQRSRVNWLNYGDRNSKFFYTTLIQRRQRNQILRLKAHDGVWKESEDDINLEIGHYFTSLFEDDGPRDFSTSIEHISPSVTREMNRILTKQVTDEEIRVAVFQMGALKAPVADFINPTSDEWRIAKLRQVLSEEEVQAVANIPISKLGGADSIIWGLHPSGKYTVKRGYHKAWSDYIDSKPERPSTSTVPGPSFWNFMWNLNIPPKLKHFWWRACRNKLATKENLVQRKCATSPICQRCGKAIESGEHILFLCKWARKVFFASPIAGVFFPNEIGSIMAWSLRMKEEIDNGNLEPVFFAKAIFLCWFIWKARNDLVFQSLKQSPFSTVARALGAWDEFVSATETTSSTHQSPPSSLPLPSSVRIPPGAGSLKINCDASWSRDLKRGWGGIILRDNCGHLVNGRRFRISSTSAFLAEASVLREACLFAKALNLSSVCIENDNAQLISLSVSELVPPWEALAIISDIRLLASDLRLSFCWTPWEGNEAAHWIASSQASSLGLNWVVSPGSFVFYLM
ncbi:hypothetical protein RHGRI_006924 [Rhododendron griersonianum]|uniref:Reverse transcriptase zinc-binding domain-containing protein n=1 Tax=Rhododendron griersonianum TaxID=479676 RepID=A0AAV6KUY4_9ERIC|nr:hypothetical protein RHGRI_006924 [Rhododendron griersonianum]